MAFSYHEDGSTPAGNQVFVFGSNLGGFHGAGAAKFAHRGLAFPWGKGEGLDIASMAYALPTKDGDIKTMSLDTIEWYIARMCDSMTVNRHLKWFFTRFGCVLAGYTNEEIATILKRHLIIIRQPSNTMSLPKDWEIYFKDYPF